MIEATEVTETPNIAALPPADRALIVLESSKTEIALRELVADCAEITEVRDSAGREQAHRLGMRLRTARTSIEKAGKAAREDAQAFSKAVIAEEKRLIAITDAEEKRVLALRDEFDAKIAAEKAAKEAAERARVNEIQQKIEAIRRLPLELSGESADTIAVELDALATFVPTEDVFAEFTEEARAARGQAIEEIALLAAKVRAREDLENELTAAREKLAAERAALEAERAALEAERSALEAAKSHAEPQFVMATKTMTMDETRELFPEAVAAEADLDDLAPIDDGDVENAAQPVPWPVRALAMHTAAQFIAMADKVEVCGATDFAQQLRAIAENINAGSFDEMIGAADWNGLARSDIQMEYATKNCLDAIDKELKEMAA